MAGIASSLGDEDDGNQRGKPGAKDDMELHPRHIPVEEARRDLSKFLMEFQERHMLTPAEYLHILTEEMASELKLLIRSERDKR